MFPRPQDVNASARVDRAGRLFREAVGARLRGQLEPLVEEPVPAAWLAMLSPGLSPSAREDAVEAAGQAVEPYVSLG
jgi:hypothetical protein